MRRILPLLVFIVLIAGVLATRFWIAPDRPVVAEVTPSAVPAPPGAAANGGTNTAAPGATAAAGDDKKPAPPLLPPLPEVQIDAHPPHAVPAERVLQVTRDLHLPPVPHPNANFYSGGKNGGSSVEGRMTNSGVMRNVAPKQFSGPARVTESTALLVGDVPVQLFGVHSLASAERCGPYRCVSVAIAALNSRLARNATVFCRTPMTSQNITYAICLDAEGADLGGYLVGEGLARADPAQSYDYVGAEKIAHDLRRGIWKH